MKMTKYKYKFFIRSFKEPYGIKVVIFCNKKQSVVQDLIYQAIKNYDSGKEIPPSINNKMTYLLWFIKNNMDCEMFSYTEFENLFI
jgi:hypothetical protein